MSGWISVEVCKPQCPHECTTDHCMVSQTLLVSDSNSPSLGMAHMREDGTWKMYGGDYDFMWPENITHWMAMPEFPQ